MVGSENDGTIEDKNYIAYSVEAHYYNYIQITRTVFYVLLTK